MQKGKYSRSLWEMLESWVLSMQFLNFQSLDPQGRGRNPEGLKPRPSRALCPHFIAMNSARKVLLGQGASQAAILPDRAPLASP